MLPAEEDCVLRIAAMTGVLDPFADTIRVRYGEPVAGVVAQNRIPLLVNGRRVRNGNRRRGYSSGSYIVVPVRISDQSYGVLSVADPIDGDTFEQDDLQALQALAEQLSASLTFDAMNQKVVDLELAVHGLRREVVRVQELERQRVARELHDGAGHALTAAVLRLDLEIARRAHDVAALNTLNMARQELVDCAKMLHEIAFNLRPRILEDLGLHAAVTSIARYTMQFSALDVTVDIRGDHWALDELEELAVLRIVQEALTNSRKHARASRVIVSLEYDRDYLVLHVEDDGIGLDRRSPTPPAMSDRVSMGIVGMRERIELLGGTFWAGRGPLGGTLVSAMLPH